MMRDILVALGGGYTAAHVRYLERQLRGLTLELHALREAHQKVCAQRDFATEALNDARADRDDACDLADELRRAAQALVNALPKCHRCGAPATWESGQRPTVYCEEHVPEPYDTAGGLVTWGEMDFAAPLRGVLALLQNFATGQAAGATRDPASVACDLGASASAEVRKAHREGTAPTARRAPLSRYGTVTFPIELAVELGVFSRLVELGYVLADESSVAPGVAS